MSLRVADHLRGLDHAAAEHVLLVSPLLLVLVLSVAFQVVYFRDPGPHWDNMQQKCNVIRFLGSDYSFKEELFC